MLRTHFWGKTVVALLAGCLVAAAGLAQAAPAPKDTKPAETPMAIGTFDMDVVFPQYIGFQKANERFKTFYEERGSVLNEMQLGLGLNAKDFDEFAGLTGHIVKLNADRITELKALAKKNKDTYEALNAKSKENKLTDAEKTQLTQLEDDLKSASDKIERKTAALGAEVEQEYSRYSTIVMDLIYKAIEDVAKAKKLSIVIARDVTNKDGKQRVVYWGGTDISKDVITLLNTEFKETMLDRQPEKPAAGAPQP